MAEKKSTKKTEGASPVVAAPEAPEAQPRTKSLKKGKLLSKNKHRLPRRQKKAEQKAAGRL